MKLIEILKEIQITSPGRVILWGIDKNDSFTGLTKVKGFKRSQDVLDEVNKILGLDENSPYTSYSTEDFPIPYQTYVYFADDGQVSFTPDLSTFDDSYTTEEGWGIDKWSKQPPLPR